MGNTVVCGIDSAERAARVTIAAAALAEGLRADLELVHVQQPTGLFRRRSGAGSRGRSLRRDLTLLADALGPRTGVRLMAGEPADELMRVADERDSALLVVGSRGQRELGRAVLGGVSSGLMLGAPCPVAVLPAEAPVAPAPRLLRSTVCGVEGADRDRAVLRLAADLVERIGGDLHALHSVDPRPMASPGAPRSVPAPELRQAAEVMVERLIERSAVNARSHVAERPPAAALEDCARRVGAGLIVIGSQGLGRLGSAVMGSVAIQLIAQARRPIVVLPPGAQLDRVRGHYETRLSSG
jgi:nucleotide-binding universal stress UspA family protein